MAAQALPMVLLAPWAGSVLDRVPLRRVLFVTALLGALQAACLAVLALTGTINLAWVFGLAIGLGCIQVFDRPGGQAFIAELVPREAIAGAVGLASSAQAIGRLGGPALARGAVRMGWRGQCVRGQRGLVCGGPRGARAAAQRPSCCHASCMQATAPICRPR